MKKIGAVTTGRGATMSCVPSALSDIFLSPTLITIQKHTPTPLNMMSALTQRN